MDRHFQSLLPATCDFEWDKRIVIGKKTIANKQTKYLFIQLKYASENTCKLLVGNKTDKVSDKVIPTEKAKVFTFYLTSLRTI
jgi:hypothetical protein